MKQVSIAELKARAPKVVRQVEEGEPCLITRRNRPVARLTGCSVERNRTRIGFDRAVKIDADLTEPVLDAGEWGDLWNG